MAALDTDEDGQISSAEIENAVAALKTLDKDEDGKLTEFELRPDFGRRGIGGRGVGGRGFDPDGRRGGRRGNDPGRRAERFMARDQNEDGKLSEDELPERMRRVFGRADADKDGFVTKAELTKFFANSLDAEGRRRGRRPDGDRPKRPRRPE